MKIEKIDFARTNYILNQLRDFLGLSNESYVKWFYGGAFNGAGLTNKDESDFFNLKGMITECVSF